MRKIISLFVLIVLSFSMISCLGENQIEGISCTGFKSQYYVDEVIDTSNVVVTVKYTVDKSANYTVGADELEFVLPDMSTAGSKVIKVTYTIDGQSYSTEKSINVVERKVTLVDLAVEQGLAKSSYFVGDVIDLSNITLKATYSIEAIDEPREEILNFDDFKDGIEEFSTSAAGSYSISITFGGKTVNIDYSVEENSVIEFKLLNVDTINALYYIGDSIDTSKITAQLVYKNGDVVDVANSELTISDIDTSTKGDKVITVKYGNLNKTINTKVEEVVVTKLELITSITSNLYYVGDIIDTSSITVKAIYNNGDEVIVANSELTISGVDTSKVGEKQITISYKGKSLTIDYFVDSYGNKILSIEIIQSIEDKTYYVGDSIDTSVIKVRVNYKDETDSIELNASELEINSVSEGNITTIKIEYEGFEKEIIVNFVPVVLQSIEFVTSLSTTQYFVGDVIDTSVIVVKAIYNNGNVVNLTSSDLIISGVDTTTDGQRAITVTYEGKVLTINYSVLKVLPILIEIVTGLGLENNEIVAGNALDTSVIVVRITYNNGATKELKASQLVMNEISTAVAGDKNLVISYSDNGTTVTYTIVVHVLERTYNYEIDFIEAPVSIITYETNIAEKSEFTSEYYNRDKGYLVGNQNPFKFFPSIQASDDKGNEVVVTEYHSYSRLYLVNGDSKRELLGDELANYVEINEYTSEYQFTPFASGSEFELKVQPYDNRGTENNVVSFRFKVVDGYNVYNSNGLILINNHPEYLDDWADYIDKNEIELPNYSVSTLILHDTIVLTEKDFPETFFHTENIIGDPNNIDYHTDTIKGTLIDNTHLYGRRLKQNETFTIHGNYFTIDSSKFPVVSNYDYDGSNSQLFYFDSEDSVTKSNVYIDDLTLFGNANKNNSASDFGGLLATKIHGNHGFIDCQFDNMIVKSFMVNQLTAYAKAKTVLNDCKLYDSYGNLAFAHEQCSVTYNNSYIVESGGPLIVAQYGYDSEAPDKFVDINLNGVEMASQLFGTEAWFISAGYASLFYQITALNAAFQAQGKIQGFVDTSGSVSIPIAINYLAASGDSGYSLTKVTIDGNTLINTFDDQTTKYIISQIKALESAYSTSIPLFFNSNGSVALFNNVALIDPLTQNPLSADNPFFTSGDYLIMYYGGSVFVFGYNTNKIAG